MGFINDLQDDYGIGFVIFLGLLAAVFAFCIFITLFYFFLWLKWSLLKRSNSKNYSGSDYASIIMKKCGINHPHVRTKLIFGGYRYWNYSRRNERLSLKTWTGKRHSIWTMQEAAQQSLVAGLINDKAKKRWLIRGGSLLSKVLILVGFGASIYLLIEPSAISSAAEHVWWFAMIGILVLALWLHVYAEAYIRKHIREKIKNTLSAEEEKIMNRIYTVKLVYAVANAIYETIILILRILVKVAEKENKK